jgi:hypothetical protein
MGVAAFVATVATATTMVLLQGREKMIRVARSDWHFTQCAATGRKDSSGTVPIWRASHRDLRFMTAIADHEEGPIFSSL